MRVSWFAVLTLLVVVCPDARSDDLEDQLQRDLVGAWAIVTIESYSGCEGTYSNNEINNGRASSKAEHRFEPGELVKIDKVNVKRSRVDVFVTLEEPILTSWIDGPFELFDERQCKAQLMFEIPRELVKQSDREAVLGTLSEVLETHSNRGAAQSSPRYNRRRREPYPSDYEQTLARYQVWKAEQTNAAVAARAQQALGDARRTLDRVDEDPHYLAGFAAGVDTMRRWWSSDCDRLIEARFDREEKDAPSDRRGGSDEQRHWRDGFRDGQELAFNLVLADRLGECYVPIPPLP
jgi:hypothetical protein